VCATAGGSAASSSAGVYCGVTATASETASVWRRATKAIGAIHRQSSEAESSSSQVIWFEDRKGKGGKEGKETVVGIRRIGVPRASARGQQATHAADWAGNLNRADPTERLAPPLPFSLYE
jgi:hypothetical protein